MTFASGMSWPWKSGVRISILQSGRLAADLADDADERARALVGEVVAVDARDDRVAQAHPRDLARDARGLERVVPRRLAGLDVAEAAAARARVAEDHERRGAALPALADVRARGLLADRVEVVVVDPRCSARGSARRRARDLEPRRLALAERPDVGPEDLEDVHAAGVRARAGLVLGRSVAHPVESTRRVSDAASTGSISCRGARRASACATRGPASVRLPAASAAVMSSEMSSVPLRAMRLRAAWLSCSSTVSRPGPPVIDSVARDGVPPCDGRLDRDRARLVAADRGLERGGVLLEDRARERDGRVRARSCRSARRRRRRSRAGRPSPPAARSPGRRRGGRRAPGVEVDAVQVRPPAARR